MIRDHLSNSEEGHSDGDADGDIDGAVVKHGSVTNISLRNPVTFSSSDCGRYTSYEVYLETTNKAFTLFKSRVRRRYSEFVWLRNVLSRSFPRKKIAELPPKTVFLQDRFSQKFIEGRMEGLEKFLHSSVADSELLSNTSLHLFLQSHLTTNDIDRWISGKGRDLFDDPTRLIMNSEAQMNITKPNTLLRSETSMGLPKVTSFAQRPKFEDVENAENDPTLLNDGVGETATMPTAVPAHLRHPVPILKENSLPRIINGAHFASSFLSPPSGQLLGMADHRRSNSAMAGELPNVVGGLPLAAPSFHLGPGSNDDLSKQSPDQPKTVTVQARTVPLKPPMVYRHRRSGSVSIGPSRSPLAESPLLEDSAGSGQSSPLDRQNDSSLYETDHDEAETGSDDVSPQTPKLASPSPSTSSSRIKRARSHSWLGDSGETAPEPTPSDGRKHVTFCDHVTVAKVVIPRTRSSGLIALDRSAGGSYSAYVHQGSLPTERELRRRQRREIAKRELSNKKSFEEECSQLASSLLADSN